MLHPVSAPRRARATAPEVHRLAGSTRLLGEVTTLLPTAWNTHSRWWPTAIAAAVVAGVFALPWFVPVRTAVILSESQAVGFNNRVAALALAAGVVVLFVFARFRPHALAAEPDVPFASTKAPPAHDGVSPWLVGSMMALTLLMVTVLGAILKDSPFGDGQYFTDRMLRAIAGGTPFSQIEFSYGPLTAYLPLLSWRALRWTGTSVYTVYYVWVGLTHMGGLAATAYLLNRIALRRSFRNAAFLLVAGFGLLQPTLGLNYTPFRFLLPYALFIWVLGLLSRDLRSPIRQAAPLFAVAVAAGISPEMGIALLVALAVALLVLVFRDRTAYVFALLLMLVGAVVGVVIAYIAGAGTLGAFAGGAYYFPVLPGPSALVFVGSMLLLAWGLGSGGTSAHALDNAVQVGWLALAVVLIVPALGRADFVHVFFNGLGAILLCIAVIDRRWRKGGLYIALVAAVFLTSMVIYIGMNYSAAVTQAGLKTLMTSRRGAVLAAKIWNDPSLAGRTRRAQFVAAGVKEARVATRLAAIPSLGFPGYLRGELGQRIAFSGHLLPTYFQPGNALDEADFRRVEVQLAAVKTLAVQTSQLVRYRQAAEASMPNAQGLVMTRPRTVGSSAVFGVLLGFPVTLKGRNVMFNPSASYGIMLQRDWVTYEVVGQYTLLRRR